MIALIPARRNSKRLPNKNFLYLDKKPLWYWTVEAAQQSGVFDQIYICTDAAEKVSMGLADWDKAKVLPREPVPDDQPDLIWVTDAIQRLSYEGDLAVLRPTSPFRDAECIKRAASLWGYVRDHANSLRAITPSREHPFKSWIVEDEWRTDVPNLTLGWDVEERIRFIVPITTAAAKKRLYELPTQSLTPAYVQCGAIEITKTSTIASGSMSGEQVVGFLMSGAEALDINDEDDWARAEAIAHDLTCSLSQLDHELGRCSG